MDSQEQCLEAILNGNVLVSRDGLEVFMYDGSIVNQVYEIEDISFVNYSIWDLKDE